jgi:hypothetical protein
VPIPPIRSEVEAQAASFHERFQSAQPFPHLVVDNFLEPAFAEQLLREFPGFDEKLALNEFGVVGRKAVRQSLATIGPAYAKFDQLLQSPAFLDWLGTATGIPGLHYDPAYVGGGTHENLDGQDLDVHVDFNYHPHNRLHRRLNLILFMNPEWEEAWGGCLQLHRNPWVPPEEDEIQTIVPLLNRMAIFETSETSWHGFRRIVLPEGKRNYSRRSIAVYFYTKARPVGQAAPSHGTVYVPRHLPSHIRAGHTLTEHDEALVHDLIGRRDTQIRFLYEREKEVSEHVTAMHKLLESPPHLAARAISWPVRRALRFFEKKP